MRTVHGRALLVLALLALAGGTTAAESFATPPRAAGVHAWWHWVDGAITREGITKDLEALAKQGVVQATILNVGLFEGRDFGVPRVRFASPEWFAMLRFALDEAKRVGIRIGVHNCDGWSSSGGPWVAPEQSMKQLAWTKALVEGGRPLDLALVRPAEVSGFYRDVAVVAYPTASEAERLPGRRSPAARERRGRGSRGAGGRLAHQLARRARGRPAVARGRLSPRFRAGGASPAATVHVGRPEAVRDASGGRGLRRRPGLPAAHGARRCAA